MIYLSTLHYNRSQSIFLLFCLEEGKYDYGSVAGQEHQHVPGGVQVGEPQGGRQGGGNIKWMEISIQIPLDWLDKVIIFDFKIIFDFQDELDQISYGS